MQLHTAIFLGAQATVSGYALARGGAPERIVACELACAVAVSWLIPFEDATSFRAVEWSRLGVDLVLLAALLPVALLADRYWPMWIAAVQLDTVAVHAVKAHNPMLRAPVYAILASQAAYPILLLLACGTYRHAVRRRRIKAHEPDRI